MCARPGVLTQSPTAYTPGREVSMVVGSTSTNPRSVSRTPASAAPMSSVTGRRPIDTRTWSTSIFSEPFGVSNGTTTPEPVCSSVPTRASPCTVRPRRASDLAVGGQPAPPVDDVDLAPLEQARKALVQVAHDPGLALVRRGPVRLGLRPVGQLHTVLARVVHGAEDLGGVQQRLRRDAAAVQAGPADLVRFHQCDRQSGGRGVERGRVAAGAPAQHDDVVVGHLRSYLHALATLRSVSAISAGCGMIASSSGGLVAIDVFFAAIRVIGWSRCQKASSWIVAAISAP